MTKNRRQVKATAPVQPKPRGIKKTTTPLAKGLKGAGWTFKKLFRQRDTLDASPYVQTEKGSEP
jgi:hypothetical protein